MECDRDSETGDNFLFVLDLKVTFQPHWQQYNRDWWESIAILIIGHNVSNKSSYQAVFSRSFIPDIFRNCAPKELLMIKGKQD